MPTIRSLLSEVETKIEIEQSINPAGARELAIARTAIEDAKMRVNRAFAIKHKDPTLETDIEFKHRDD